jgi:hypothetical protein
MAANSTAVETHTGGYLYRLTSSSRKRSVRASYAPNGDMCPPPSSPSGVRRKLRPTMEGGLALKAASAAARKREASEDAACVAVALRGEREGAAN